MKKKIAGVGLSLVLASSLCIADTNPFSDVTISVTETSEVAASETATVAATETETSTETETETQKEETKTVEYTVVKGDYLIKIASKFYGDSSKWVDLVEANKDKYPSLLTNPNLIYEDWVLTIPNATSTNANGSSGSDSSATSSSTSTSSETVSADSNKVSEGSAPKYSNDTANGAPALKYQSAPTGSCISSKSPQFKTWMSNAISSYGDWAMPTVTNKYGQVVSVEMYMKGIMYIESSGIHRKSNGSLTTSCCGAQGFMQLMPETAKGLGVDATDPAQNIAGGCKLFKQIFTSTYIGKRDGVDKLVLAACGYNCGPWSKLVKGSWQDLKNSGSSVAGYGIKFKMCVGLELTEDEKNYVRNNMSSDVEGYAKTCYSTAQGLGL